MFVSTVTVVSMLAVVSMSNNMSLAANMFSVNAGQSVCMGAWRGGDTTQLRLTLNSTGRWSDVNKSNTVGITGQ